MRLGFDIDEVVCLLSQRIADELSEEYELTKKESLDLIFKFIEDYNFKINDVHGHVDEVTQFFLEKAYNEKTLLSAPVDKEAQKIIRMLKHNSHSIHFITSRSEAFKDITINWLRKNKLVFDSVHFVGHNGEKGQIARLLNLDFFLDDLEKSLYSLYKYKKRWRKGLCLLDKPWNTAYIDGSKFLRLKNWKAVQRHLGIHNRI